MCIQCGAWCGTVNRISAHSSCGSLNTFKIMSSIHDNNDTDLLSNNSNNNSGLLNNWYGGGEVAFSATFYNCYFTTTIILLEQQLPFVSNKFCWQQLKKGAQPLDRGVIDTYRRCTEDIHYLRWRFNLQRKAIFFNTNKEAAPRSDRTLVRWRCHAT